MPAHQPWEQCAADLFAVDAQAVLVLLDVAALVALAAQLVELDGRLGKGLAVRLEALDELVAAARRHRHRAALLRLLHQPCTAATPLSASFVAFLPAGSARPSLVERPKTSAVAPAAHPSPAAAAPAPPPPEQRAPPAAPRGPSSPLPPPASPSSSPAPPAAPLSPSASARAAAREQRRRACAAPLHTGCAVAATPAALPLQTCPLNAPAADAADLPPRCIGPRLMSAVSRATQSPRSARGSYMIAIRRREARVEARERSQARGAPPARAAAAPPRAAPGFAAAAARAAAAAPASTQESLARCALSGRRPSHSARQPAVLHTCARRADRLRTACSAARAAARCACAQQSRGPSASAGARQRTSSSSRPGGPSESASPLLPLLLPDDASSRPGMSSSPLSLSVKPGGPSSSSSSVTAAGGRVSVAAEPFACTRSVGVPAGGHVAARK